MRDEALLGSETWPFEEGQKKKSWSGALARIRGRVLLIFTPLRVILL